MDVYALMLRLVSDSPVAIEYKRIDVKNAIKGIEKYISSKDFFSM